MKNYEQHDFAPISCTTKPDIYNIIFAYFIFRPLLKQIKNSAESHIVLDCSTDRIHSVLKQAQQIGMMSDYHSYLITSLVSTIIYSFILFPVLEYLVRV